MDRPARLPFSGFSPTGLRQPACDAGSPVCDALPTTFDGIKSI
jgi:hypothetical protein